MFLIEQSSISHIIEIDTEFLDAPESDRQQRHGRRRRHRGPHPRPSRAPEREKAGEPEEGGKCRAQQRKGHQERRYHGSATEIVQPSVLAESAAGAVHQPGNVPGREQGEHQDEREGTEQVVAIAVQRRDSGGAQHRWNRARVDGARRTLEPPATRPFAGDGQGHASEHTQGAAHDRTEPVPVDRVLDQEDTGERDGDAAEPDQPPRSQRALDAAGRIPGGGGGLGVG